MARPTCTMAGCDKPNFGLGMCNMHYSRWRRHGSPNIVVAAGRKPRRHPLAARVTTPLETPCREGRGRSIKGGYQTIRRGGRTVGLHVWAWEQVNGPIPDGMILMHRCDNPPCFRVDHLVLGTHAANSADMVRKGRSAKTSDRTHCRNGHAYTPENTTQGKYGRRCLTCINNYERRRP